MGKILSFLLVVLALLLSAQPVQSQEFPFAGGNAYLTFLRAGYSTLERFAAFLIPSKIGFLADGGGDGGGSDGGSSGSGGSDGGGTGSGSGDGGSGAAGAGAAGAGAAGGAGTGGAGDGTGGTGDGTGDSSAAADAAAATSDAAATDASATDAAATDAAAAADAAATDASAAAAATDAAAAAATDAAATDAATTNAAADNTSVTTDPTSVTNAITVATQQSEPTNVNNAVTPELSAIEDIATTDPRGGEDVSPPVNNGIPGGAAPAPALGGPGAAPVDVAINAVIVSAAQSPWDAIRRAPGVRNVIITGGIIALGKTPIAGEIPGGGPQPAWLRLIPDLRLLNGSAIPPVVPNVIDVRIMNCPIKIDNAGE